MLYFDICNGTQEYHVFMQLILVDNNNLTVYPPTRARITNFEGYALISRLELEAIAC